MLIEQVGGISDWITSLIPAVLDPGVCFCAGLLLGVVLGCFISLSAFAGLKMDERLEKSNDNKRGDEE